MTRWPVFLLLFLATGCSTQLTVLTEEINYITPLDFSNEEIIIPSKTDVPLVAIEHEVETNETETVLIEDALAEIEEFDNALIPKYVGIPLTVEALVGQVNGRPVYANTVLGPVADQISAAAKRMSRTDFADEIRLALYSEQEQMGTIIRSGRIYELVTDDLLLSEAESEMSEQESYGVLAVVGQLREDLASSQGGSQTQLRQSIEQQAGVSVDEFLDFQRDQILTEALYRQKAWSKVNVTWRDIQREFEQISLGDPVLYEVEDVERTNAVITALRMDPPIPLGRIEEARGTVTLGMIRFKKDDPLVEKTQRGFDEGLSFQEVATSVGVANGGVWDTFRMGLGGIEDIEVGPAIKRSLWGVTEGEYVGPIEMGTRINWFAVLEIQMPISLYNRRVQIALYSVLREIQYQREENRYAESLWGEGTLDEVKAMAERVTNIAVQRYQQ